MASDLRAAVLAIVSLTLVSCGGGGGSDSASSPLQVTPGGSASTPPPPPPPPTLTYPTAPSSIVSPTEFTLLDTIHWNPRVTKIAASDISLRWLGQPATYGLRIAGVGEGELRQMSGTDPALRLVDASGQVLMTSLDISQVKGRYTALLHHWTDPYIATAFGVATLPVGLPTTGTRAFREKVTGQNIKIDIDFAARRITGSIDLAWQDAWGPYDATTYSLTPTTFAPGATTFSIPFTVPGAPDQGIIVGRLTGPNAEEMMIAWRGQVKSIYDESWETQGGVTFVTSTP